MVGQGGQFGYLGCGYLASCAGFDGVRNEPWFAEFCANNSVIRGFFCSAKFCVGDLAANCRILKESADAAAAVGAEVVLAPSWL